MNEQRKPLQEARRAKSLQQSEKAVMLNDVPGFRAERCIRHRHTHSCCSRCADACPEAAIHLCDGGVEIRADAETCGQCAQCVAACPTEALTGEPVSAEALERYAEQKRLRIACAPSGLAADARVSCLGALHPILLAYLAMQGMILELAGTNHCGACQNAATGVAQISTHRAAFDVLRKANAEAEWAPVSYPSSARIC